MLCCYAWNVGRPIQTLDLFFFPWQNRPMTVLDNMPTHQRAYYSAENRTIGKQKFAENVIIFSLACKLFPPPIFCFQSRVWLKEHYSHVFSHQFYLFQFEKPALIYPSGQPNGSRTQIHNRSVLAMCKTPKRHPGPPVTNQARILLS